MYFILINIAILGAYPCTVWNHLAYAVYFVIDNVGT